MYIKRSDQFMLIIAIVLLPLYFFLDPSLFQFFPKCPFLFITNLECPGCGSQRAIHQLLHLNFLAAIKFNLLLVIFLPILTYYFTLKIISKVLQRNFIKFNVFLHKTTPYFVGIITLIFWILRNTVSYKQFINSL